MYLFVCLAAAGALYFAVAAVRGPRPGVIVAAIAWLLYAVYEYYIANGTLCEANCNIRVDLILVWPLLGLVSLFGIYPPGRWTGPGKTLAKLGFGFIAAIAVLFLYMVLVEKPAVEKAAKAPATPSGRSAAGAP